MDEYQDEHHGHPVIAGAVVMVTTLAARQLARAYLVRASGSTAADTFFRKASRRIAAGVIAFFTLLAVAVFISYASLTAADGIAVAAVILAFLLAVPPVFTILGYAGRQARYLRQCGSSYLR